MLGIVSSDQLAQQPRIMNQMVLPNELSKTESAAEKLLEQVAFEECTRLCRMGSDPEEIQECMEYCEKLIYTTVEMQRLAHTRQRPTSMLFEGMAEAASNQLHQMSEGQSHPSDHEDLTVVPAPASSYKLLSRESMNILCMLSLTLGCLAVLLFVFAQRHFKHDFGSGGH